MKKIAITITMLYCALTVSSQKKETKSINSGSVATPIKIIEEPRFLINLHLGYSVGLGSTFKFYPDDISSITIVRDGSNPPTKTTRYSNPTRGLGDGFRLGFGGSYIVNDFINVGIDFDYFKSTIKKYRDSSMHKINQRVINNSPDEYYYTERNTNSYTATLLTLTPSITFKAISKPRWFLYNKLGAVITFRPNSLQEDRTDKQSGFGWQGVYTDSSSTVLKKYEWKIRNPALGFMGAFGGQIKVSGNIRAFAEIQYSHIVFVIKRRTLTDFIVDGQHIENTFPLSMREIEFVKSYSSDDVNNDPDKPSQTIIQRIPISYIGLQAGICFQLK